MTANDNGPLPELARSLAGLEEESLQVKLKSAMDKGVPPLEIIGQLSAGMDEVGKRFKEGEYFLSELVYSGELFRDAMAKVKPLLDKAGKRESAGKVVMGTVKGDIHDLGKNIVITLLECAGFEVTDLGVDVPAEKFVQALKDSGAALVGLSALLTTAFPSMEATINSIKDAGMGEKVKIMIGGSSTSNVLRKNMNADFYGRDATEAVDIARRVFDII